MQLKFLFFSCLVLSACTRSCSQSQSTAEPAKTSETWIIKADQLTNSVGLSLTETLELTLSKDELKLHQGTQNFVFRIVEWDSAGVAKLAYNDKKGFFKWDIVPGEKRSEDRQYSCGNAPDAPVAVTRVEEAKQIRLVTLLIEGASGQPEYLSLKGHLPNENLWVETGSYPIKLCK